MSDDFAESVVVQAPLDVLLRLREAMKLSRPGVGRVGETQDEIDFHVATVTRVIDLKMMEVMEGL